MQKFLFVIFLFTIYCESCAVSKQVFKDELSLGQSNGDAYRFDSYYRNDSLDFAFSYYPMQKFNIFPSKKDLSKAYLPQKWLLDVQKDKVEVLFYTKTRDRNKAFMGIAYKTNNTTTLYDYSLNILQKSKECILLEKDLPKKSLKYIWTAKDSAFSVQEFYRTYKNVPCKFVFFEKFSKTDSLTTFSFINDYFGHEAVMETFQDSVKYKIFQSGKIFSFSLMSEAFSKSNYNYLRPFFWSDKFKKEVSNEMLGEDQALRTYYAFIGDYKKSLTNVDAGIRKALSEIKVDSTELNKYQAVDAITAILEKSKDRQLVILNEHHQNSESRVFAQKLLRGLYEQGFRYLSMETIYDDSLPNILKYPIQNIGVYTADPMFGNFIRAALTLGFRITKHENYDVPCDEQGRANQINCRDYNQALNIQKIYKKDPHAKVLAYVGHSHILKNVQESGGLWLGGQFKKLTGIDPLTIDQTVMREVLPATDENPIYRYVEHKFIPKESIVLKKNDTYWIDTKRRGDVDIEVFHPRSSYIDGHPEWLLKLGDKKFPIHLNDKKYQGTLLQVFIAHEQENTQKYPAMPLMNVPLKEKNNFDIFLPSGKYYIRTIDYLGNIFYFNFKTL